MNKHNTEYSIYGLNNAISLLSSKKYLINDIVIMKGGIADSDSRINEYIRTKKDSVHYFNKNDFLSKYNIKHSQGIVIHFSANILQDFSTVDFAKENICYIIIDQINDPQNLGQIIRTCECAGIDGIILPKHGSVHVTNTVLQVSQGAFLLVDIFIENNLVNSINFLKDNGYWIIGVENSISAKKWFDMDYQDKTAVVIGSEGDGIRRLVKESCDFLATIPMKGKIDSLNVSAALSAVVFERQRQLEINK